jgi:hypothetical protein
MLTIMKIMHCANGKVLLDLNKNLTQMARAAGHMQPQTLLDTPIPSHVPYLWLA